MRRKVMGYKIAYCMGVPENILKKDFKECHANAAEIGYWDDKKFSKSFRVAARLYFNIISDNVNYSGNNFINNLTDDTDIKYSELMFDVSEATKNPQNLPMACSIAREANSLLTEVYKELEIGIDFQDFFRLFYLDHINVHRLFTRRFIARQQVTGYNIYFSWNEVFNSNIKYMLSSDTVILQRISIVNGNFQQKVVDTSKLTEMSNDMVEGCFIHLNEMSKFEKVYVDMSNVDNDTIGMLQRANKGDMTFVNGPEALKKLLPEKCDRTTLVVCRAETREILKDNYDLPDVTICLVMPVKSALYKEVTSDVFDNVFLLSTKD